jgi:aspartyl aminopeptidase
MVPKPILRIPMLAIHLQRDLSTAGFNPNKQTQCTPLLASSIKSKLEGGAAGAPAAAAARAATGGAEGAAGAGPDSASPGAAAGSEGVGASAATRHHPLLLRLLAKELGCAVEDIVDFELNVIDTQAGVIGGGCVGCLAGGGLGSHCILCQCCPGSIALIPAAIAEHCWSDVLQAARMSSSSAAAWTTCA